MCAVSDAGHLAVLLAGLVQTLVTVDVDQGQLLHSRDTERESVCDRMQIRFFTDSLKIHISMKINLY